MRRIVVDASVTVRLCLEAKGFALLAATHDLHAPPLLWSEAMSVLHELRWRNEISDELAGLARDRPLSAPVVATADIHPAAWHVADDAGWAKTYDAEYVASAAALDCPLVTLDARLRRGARRFVEVLAPVELHGSRPGT